MREDKSTITTLQNNAKMIGNVVGAEEAFLKGKKAKTGDYYFLDQPILNIQDVTFKTIEKT